MSQYLTDTHCHLDFNAFDVDLDEVIERARSVGIVRILNPGIDLDTSLIALRLADKYPEVYVAVGIHPNSAMEWNEHTLENLQDLASHPKVVAIGEIGLDYYRDRAPREHQRMVFAEQLALAADINLPVVIHNRQASDDLVNLLTGWHTQLINKRSELISCPGVMHSYTDNLEIAREVLLLNLMIGITGPVTFRNAIELQSVVKSLPITSLVVETDAPFLAPHPMRGQRNEPAYVVRVADKIAELHGLSLQSVANITTANADQLFKWRESN